jgi:hypothetical protein
MPTPVVVGGHSQSFGPSGGPRFTCPWAAKIRSSSSGAGRGASGGGSVGTLAGTAPSRTMRSSPARAEHEHQRCLAVYPKGVRYPHRDDSGCTGLKLETLLAGLNRESSLQHDVALVLGMGVKRRRGMVRKQELNQCKTPARCVARQLDRCQCSQELEPLAVPRGRPCRRCDPLARHPFRVSQAVSLAQAGKWALRIPHPRFPKTHSAIGEGPFNDCPSKTLRPIPAE